MKYRFRSKAVFLIIDPQFRGAMYELIKVTEKCYYINCPSKIGIIRGEDDGVYLIDSGNSRDTGKKILKILKQNGWRLLAIYNSHSHADHIGGNKYLQGETGCKIYAPGIERDFTRSPILESSFLYGGFPPEELQRRFMLAEESYAEPLTDDVLPKGIKAIALPGHFFDMVGFITDDGAAFIADALSSREILDKYAISYIYDVEAYIKTLDSLKNIDAKIFIPSHTEATDNIAPLAEYNISKVREISELIISICDTPITFEEILKRVFDFHSLTMSFEQYALVGSAVRSYLSYLKKTGQVSACIAENRLIWKSN